LPETRALIDCASVSAEQIDEYLRGVEEPFVRTTCNAARAKNR
jgi:hypothetical protein